jgi:hypothetical protein
MSSPRIVNFLVSRGAECTIAGDGDETRATGGLLSVIPEVGDIFFTL